MTGTYFHKVQYYERDAMRIVHHSNYIRWFEEARLDCLKRDGFGYEVLEARGIQIPVLSVSCEYKAAVVYGETVQIQYALDYFKGIRMGISYRVLSEDGTLLHATGTSTHTFLDQNLRPLNIKKYAPDIYHYFTI